LHRPSISRTRCITQSLPSPTSSLPHTQHTHTHSLSFFLTLSFSLFRSHSLSLPPTLSLSHAFILSRSFSHRLTLALSHSFNSSTLPLFQFYHSLVLSLFHSLALSHSFSAQSQHIARLHHKLSLSLSLITVSHSHLLSRHLSLSSQSQVHHTTMQGHKNTPDVRRRSLRQQFC